MPIDDQEVVFGRAGRFRAAHFATEPPLDGIVFEQVRQVIGGNKIVHRDNINCFAEQPLITNGAKDEPANAPEAVDGDLSHYGRVFMNVSHLEMVIANPASP
jgi:hypothetical protein